MVQVVSATPAAAGTLTSTSFAANGGYAYASSQNTQFDWAFITATTATLTRASMTVPTGTNATNRYLDLTRNYSTGGYASTPDSAANSISGDLDLRAKVTPTQWAGFGYQPVIAKMSSSDGSFEFAIDNNGRLIFAATSTGSSPTYWYGNILGFSNGATSWVRATYARSTGVVNFYISNDGSTWTSGGSQTKTALSSTYDGSQAVRIGSNNWSNSFIGKIYYAEIRNGIGGSVVNSFDPSFDSIGGTSWTASTGETFSLSRVGTDLPIDISSDLTVSQVNGLPSGGTARYRMIDGTAGYYFSATSVSSAVNCKLSLLGFINTSAAGSYTSTITTFNNSATPTAVDMATTSALTLLDSSQSLNVRALVEPELTFTVSGRNSTCNNQSSINFQTTSTGTSVSIGAVSTSTVGGAAQNLSVTTNADGGFSVYVRTADATPNPLRYGSSHLIADVGGTAASPGAAPVAGTAGFGYTTNDTSTAFTSNKFAKLTNANDAILLAAAGTQTKSACVGYEVAIGPSTPSGTYSTTVVYTTVPTY